MLFIVCLGMSGVLIDSLLHSHDETGKLSGNNLQQFCYIMLHVSTEPGNAKSSGGSKVKDRNSWLRTSIYL